MEESIITTTADKNPLPESRSVSADGVSTNKMAIIKAAAIITTPPVDIATIKDTLEVAANISQIASLPISIAAIAISMKHDKDKHPEINATEREISFDSKGDKNIKSKHSPRKKHK
jgi:hypothetical protein